MKSNEISQPGWYWYMGKDGWVVIQVIQWAHSGQLAALFVGHEMDHLLTELWKRDVIGPICPPV